MENSDSFYKIVKDFLVSEPPKDKKTQQQIGGGRFIPEKIALLKLLYHRKQVNDNHYLNKSIISKILFEQKTNHVDHYFNGETSYLIDSDSKLGPLKFIDWNNSPTKLYRLTEDSFLKIISDWEQNILIENKENRDKYTLLVNFVNFGLNLILKKYEEFFSKLSGEEISKICNSIKQQKFQTSFGFKLLSKIIPQVDSMSRLVLDALMYSAYCLVLGSKYNLLLQNDVTIHTMEKITSLFLNSQGKNGAWALGDYDRFLMAKDTAMILYLLKEVKEVFPSIPLDKSKIKKSLEFLKDSMDDLVKDERETVKLESEYMRQLGFYTSVQMIAGYYSAVKILDKDDDVFAHPFTKQFFIYLSKLEKHGGYARDYENKPDIETTSFVANTLLGENSFDLNDNEVSLLMEKEFSSMNIINFFNNNQKTIRDFLNKGQDLNVVTDSMSALLWCGVWPLSSQVMDMLVESCEKSRKELEKFKKIPLIEIQDGKMSVPLKLGPMYWNVMPSIHVLHQTLLCLNIINQYLKNPEGYWKKVESILK